MRPPGRPLRPINRWSGVLLVGGALLGACGNPVLTIGSNGPPDFGHKVVDLAAARPDLVAVAPRDLAGADRPIDPGCDPGLVMCGGLCVDTSANINHCGRCNRSCGIGQACVVGACVCNGLSCPNGCCQSDQCLPGTDDNACGLGGVACAVCPTRCINGGCAGCVPGGVQSTQCGNCGTRTRTCQNNGVWGPFENCSGEGDCAPAATRTIPCGACGQENDWCDNTCHWVSGGCNGQGGCTPGMTRQSPCGQCGTQTDTCDNGCNWIVGGCNNQGPCKPGTTKMSSCGFCGTETDTCGNTCQWMIGGCNNQGVCTPNTTRSGGCDMCSQQTCGGNCLWGSCALKPGNACEHQGGNNKRNCKCGSPCSGTPYQWCLASCQWSTACACCTAQGCPQC